MKRIAICIIILLVITVNLYAEKPVTTVLDFKVNSVSENDMKSIISFLSASLYDTGKFRVIDTAQRDTILNELEFSLSGCSDDSCQLEIGKLLSAEYIVIGDIAKVGTRYLLSSKMLETETSETAGTAKGIYTTLDELIDDMPAFAATLAGVQIAAPLPVETAPAEETAEKPAEVIEPKSISTEVDTNKIIAWSTLGAGVVIAGTGSYFLIDSILKLNAASVAWDAYNTATTDFTNLHNSYLDAYAAAENSNAMFWLGAGLAGVGLASTAISIVFFSKLPSDAQDSIALALGPQSIAVRLSY